MYTRTKALLAAAVTVPLVLGTAGTAYATHFQDRALPGSSLAGVSVAGLTRDEVADAVRQRAAGVTVTMATAAATRTEHLADLGYSVDVEATVDAVFDANDSWSSYATSLVSSRDVSAVVVTDAATTDAVAAELVGQAGKVGTDARVERSKDRKGFVVEPAVPGQTVTRSSLHDVAASAARDLSSTTTTLEFVEAVPTVTTAEAQQVADQANALAKRTVTVSDGDDEHSASAKTRASWVTIPTSDGVPGTPAVDAAKLRSWVAGLAKDAEVEPSDGLRYVDSAGTIRAVKSSPRDGRVVSNAPDLAKAAAAALLAGKRYSGDFDYTKVPATWKERRIAAGAENLAYPAADGEKWIDVDLGSKTMTAYVGADKVYGPVKVVDGAAETPTVVGTFRIYQKHVTKTMRGANSDGTRYETADVPWTSFFHRGYALHGAPWRSSFGYSGSHGCVNLPVAVAKWVYDFAPIGTPVTTHF